MVFFTFSTTQEYYSMPIYSGVALLLGAVMTRESRVLRAGTRGLTIICAIAFFGAVSILVAVRHVATPGDISQALSYNPSAYKLSLGHMEDLTLNSFAYLRLPLAVAAAAFLIGAVGTLPRFQKGSYFAVALMMVVFFHAARLAMVTFDPYLSSRPMVKVLEEAPKGDLIIDHHYFWYSSVFFYTNRTALLLNGRFFGLVYGSYAPTSADPFIDNTQLQHLWRTPARYYLFAKATQIDDLASLVGRDQLVTVCASGGKVLLTNHPVSYASGF
jgi:hypothetical protein